MIQVCAEQVPNYLHPKRDLVAVFSDSGRLAFKASPNQIYLLAHANGIMGAVDPKKARLQFVQLTIGVMHARRIVGLGKGSLPLCSPIAEDNTTVFRSGRTWMHHRARSAAYARAA